ncbi:MAG: response regulator [Candidatus Altiarchaeota archaeon]
MGRTVLVVDDDAEIVELLETLLKREGYDVLIAYGGEECLNLMAAERIDLILLDVLMPGMDGREVRRLIREAKEWAEIPIIYLTVVDLGREEKEEFIRNHAKNYYLKKPFKKANY